MLKNNRLIFQDIDKLSKQLSKDILLVANESIYTKGSFRIVLTGGNSVSSLYKILSNAKSNWDKWHIYLGDERCLPKDSKLRNDVFIKKAWISDSKIPSKNIHFINSELSDKDIEISYCNVLKEVDYFDVVLLSIGEDGHVASLFPYKVHNNNDVVIEKKSPKYPERRVSLSYSRLNKSHYVFKIVCGPSKKNALKMWDDGKILPIGQINGGCERVYICENSLNI